MSDKIATIIEYLDKIDLTEEDIDSLEDYLSTRFKNLMPKMLPGYKIWCYSNWYMMAKTKKQARELLIKAIRYRMGNKYFNDHVSQPAQWPSWDIPQEPTIYNHSTGQKFTLTSPPLWEP